MYTGTIISIGYALSLIMANLDNSLPPASIDIQDKVWDFSWNNISLNANYIITPTDLCNHNYNNNSNLKVLHINIASLPAKFDSLKNFLINCKEKNIHFDIILLAETHLTHINHNLFSLPGYKFFSAHRSNQKGGGVGIFILNRLSPKLTTDLSTFEEGIFETITIQASMNHKQLFLKFTNLHPLPMEATLTI